MPMNKTELRAVLQRTLDELPLWITELEDAVAVESILLELESDLIDLDEADEGFGPKPLDVLLGRLVESHGFDDAAVKAAVELSDLAARGSYGAFSEEACEDGSRWLEALSGGLSAWLESS